VCGLGKEIREYASVNLGLASHAALEKLLATGVERSVEEGQEGEGLGCEDLLVLLLDLARDLDALEDGILEAGIAGVGSLSNGTVDDVLLPERRRALLVAAPHVKTPPDRRRGGGGITFNVLGYMVMGKGKRDQITQWKEGNWCI
jgi:hypothetical protein